MSNGTIMVFFHTTFVVWSILLWQQVVAGSPFWPEGNPKSFAQGDFVEIKVNKLTSTEALYPLDPGMMPFCQPEGGPRMERLNLGEALAGGRIQSSPYKLQMKVDTYCEQLCVSNLGRAEKSGVSAANVVKAIRKDYHNNWLVDDDLPAAWKQQTASYITTRYWQGIPIGFIAEDTKLAYIHNHVNIKLMYHAVNDEPGMYRVVRFTVEPFSIKHDFEELTPGADNDFANDTYLSPKVAKILNPIVSCRPGIREHTNYDMVTAADREPQLASGRTLFTYDVIWIENRDLEWASRWDIYLNMDNAVPARVHWNSILNSLVYAFLLAAFLTAIFIRDLKRDKGTGSGERTEEWHGWKAVHADVFRPPSCSPLLLSLFCGTGAQLLGTASLTLSLFAGGVLSLIHHGHLIMAILLSYCAMGLVNGYVTARIYKTFGGKSVWRMALCAALGFPGLCFTMFMAAWILATFEHSTYAVSLESVIILCILWLAIMTPLIFYGAHVGFQQDAIDFPVDASSVPRKIPKQPCYMHISLAMLLGGILPFAAIFVEFYYIMASAWMGYFYASFGFLLVVFLIVLLTCAEISVLATFLQLRREDYRWWWRSFSIGGTMAIYMFLYSMVFLTQSRVTGLASKILYFGYMGVASTALFLMMGFVGMATSLWFNKAMYASIIKQIDAAHSECILLVDDDDDEA